MYKLKQAQEIDIISYCIMNNHAHILIKTEILEELSKYMQRLNTSYAKYYNKKYDRVGYVFRDRYKAEGIYSENHLYNCIKYIYDNPVKAGICDKAEEYPYSNYKKIKIELNERYKFIDIDETTEEICKNIVHDFLIENKIEKEELKENEIKLKKLIRLMKEEYKISLRKISEELEIGREKIRRLYNQ